MNGLAYIERIARGPRKNLFRVSIIGDPPSIDNLPFYLNAESAKDILDRLIREGFKTNPAYYESDFLAEYIRTAFPDTRPFYSESELDANIE
jgi:hypothetical protein